MESHAPGAKHCTAIKHTAIGSSNRKSSHAQAILFKKIQNLRTNNATEHFNRAANHTRCCVTTDMIVKKIPPLNLRSGPVPTTPPMSPGTEIPTSRSPSSSKTRLAPPPVRITGYSPGSLSSRPGISVTLASTPLSSRHPVGSRAPLQILRQRHLRATLPSWWY